MGFKLSEDFLLQHAYTNVWCTPEQDKQAIFQLARITPTNGVWTSFTYHWRKIGLPVPKSRFHVYQVGEVHPSILGLLNQRNAWVPVTLAMQQESSIIQIYTGRGRVVPRCLCWYLVTGDNNLILAVQKSEQKPVDLTGIDLETDAIYMRLYSNAFFNSSDSSITPGVRAISKRCMTVQDITTVQSQIAAWPAVGAVTCYVNSIAVDRIDAISAKPGDYVDAVFDASVKYTVQYEVNTLREFNSTRDALRKYLLTHGANTDTIDYQDDIDVFVTTIDANDRWKGVYLHKNDSRTLRQVTHRDWAVAVARVDGAAVNNSFLASKPLHLRVVVRHSGWKRPLVLENNRVFELYKLDVEKRLEAMLGVDSHVSVWRAEALEDSGYVKVMGAEQGAITKRMVQDAYGYNALSVLLGDTPKRSQILNGQNVVFIPEGLRGNATVYEYDDDGKLLTYDSITLDNTYTARHGNTKIAEVVYGVASVELDIQTGATGVIHPEYNYRFYQASAVSGVRTGEWQDVSGSAHYLIQNGQFQWVNTTGKLTKVISNKKFIGYTQTLKPNNGVLEFDLVHVDVGVYKKVEIPLGQLFIWVNGHALIEELDYFVKDARVVVTAKQYLNGRDLDEQVVVRYMGFSDEHLMRDKPADRGFVYNKVLSANNVFDIRDDKVLHITVGGKLYLKDELQFAEDGITLQVDALNGEPYSIRDIVVPMNRYLVDDTSVEDKTYTLRQLSKEIDQEISDYMTIKKPQDEAVYTNVIQPRHKLYSPFLARILSDLKSGVLWDERFVEHFGDEYVREIAQPYLHLLDYDPIAGEPKVDLRYVVVHPHLEPDYVSVGMYQWRVLERIAKVYAPAIDLSSAVSVLQF